MSVVQTTVDADAAALPPLQSFLGDFWTSEHLPDSARFPFELALEVIFINVVMHGSHGRHDVWAEVTLRHENHLAEMVLRDNGNLFDPLAAPPPDLDAAMEDRPVGGLGIHLIRTLMDEVTYQSLEGCNVLTLRKRLDETPAH